MNKPEKIASEELSEALTYPVEAFISREYAEAEPDRLWSRVWQQAGRVEELRDLAVGVELGDDLAVGVDGAREVAQGAELDAVEVVQVVVVLDGDLADLRPPADERGPVEEQPRDGVVAVEVAGHLTDLAGEERAAGRLAGPGVGSHEGLLGVDDGEPASFFDELPELLEPPVEASS